MTAEKISDFSIEKLEIMDTSGKVDEKLMPKLNEKNLLDMYEFMILSRTFDNKSLSLQRQGRLGTYASQIGQEASVIGSAYALRKKDWLVPSFRESSSMIVKGADMDKVLLYWAGDEKGSKMPANLRIMPVSIPVSTQCLHASGIAWGMKKKEENSVSLVYFGDGSTSEGDFHEALNFAGVFDLPAIFFCQNNQYAVSTPVGKQTGSETIAQKAIAYGIKGIRVDGNDLFAVYSAVKEAIKEAKKGNPTLIESFTYRISDHTTSDDASKYRSDKEVKKWKKKDPIERMEKYLKSKDLLDEKKKKKIKEESEKKVKEAVSKAESTRIKPEEIFKYTYDCMDDELKEQLENFRKKESERNG